MWGGSIHFFMHRGFSEHSVSAKFGICTVGGLDEKLVEAKIRTWNHLMCVFQL
jgi:hypothetical protein